MKNNQTTVFETLVGLNVIDDTIYSDYRANMKPILTQYEGSFGYDFVVAEVLKSETKDKINRVFTIRFPDQQKMEAFFIDDKYTAVKEKYFQKSVKNTTIISSYNKVL